MLLNEYHQTLYLEEEFWASKSRIDWTLLGEKNTSFFHLSTICRRRYNKIWSLRDSVGNWTYSPIEIKFAILTHFTTLYTSKALYTPIIVPNP